MKNSNMPLSDEIHCLYIIWSTISFSSFHVNSSFKSSMTEHEGYTFRWHAMLDWLHIIFDIIFLKTFKTVPLSILMLPNLGPRIISLLFRCAVQMHTAWVLFPPAETQCCGLNSANLENPVFSLGYFSFTFHIVLWSFLKQAFFVHELFYSLT